MSTLESSAALVPAPNERPAPAGRSFFTTSPEAATHRDDPSATHASSESQAPDEPHDPNAEARQNLLMQLHRRTGAIPVELIVEHILAIVPASEWPVRVDAASAIVRRIEAAQRDGLKIATRPDQGQVLGDYSTQRRRAATRPYVTVLMNVAPLAGSCDCPDFSRNSLGLCKHLLCILEHVASRARLWKQAEQESAAGALGVSGLRWDPIRPLSGRGDWLARVVWFESTARRRKTPTAKQEELLARWFKPPKHEHRVLKSTLIDHPTRRLELVRDLARLARGSSAPYVIDPALAKLLEHEIECLQGVAARTVTPSELRPLWKTLKRPLYPYQREGVTMFLATGRLLLADDMGLGKTAQAIAACDILLRLGRVNKVLIIAPAALKPQWAREWSHFSDHPAQVVDGSPSERIEIYQAATSGVLIMNYEQLLRDLPAIRALAPDLVVLDEAQRIKNWATKTAMAVKALSSPYRLVLTGTPMENRIEELASVVEWVDDTALEPKWRLSPLHSMRADGKREVTGVRELDTIRTRLAPCMLRRVRQDVLDQLPPRTDTRVPIAWTPSQAAEHDELTIPIISLMSIAKRRPLRQAEFLKLMSLLTTQRVISNGLAQLRFQEVWPTLRKRAPTDAVLQGLCAPKLIELRQLIRQVVVEQSRKVVIFSQWRRMLALAEWATRDLLSAAGLRSGFFTGAEGQRRRTQNLVEFHDDPSMCVLFASDAGGVGLNLQRAANCVINLELPWNPAVLEQRIARIYRLGQKQPIDVFNLVTEEGIESRIASLVDSKQAFFKGLFDGDSDAVQFEQSTSFLSKLERMVDLDKITPAGARDEAGTDEPLALAAAECEEFDAETSLDTSPDVASEPELIALLAAADESTDAANPAAPAEPGEPADGLAPSGASAALASVREAARIGHAASQEAGDSNGDTSTNGHCAPNTAAAPRSDPPAAAEVLRLFGSLSVRRAEGKVMIEAPEEAAGALAALFQGMAGLMQSLHAPQADGESSAGQ